MLDTRKLRMLAELERLGTVAAVARSLHLTAPGVSMQLAALEREVGITLTERHGRTLALTPAGTLLAQHGHGIVDMLSLAAMEVEALREGSTGTYRIAAFPSIARTIVADAWRSILDDSALALRLELIEREPEHALAALSAGEIELAVTHSYSNMSDEAGPDFVSTRIASERVWFAVRNDDPAVPATGSAADLAVFASHDWVVPSPQWTCHEMIQRACGLAGFAPHEVAEATDFSVLLALVSAGVGVALVPELAIAALPPNVILRELASPVSRHDFVVTRRAMDADPGIRRLSTLLATAAQLRVPAAA